MIEVIPFRAEHFKLEDLRDGSMPGAVGARFDDICRLYEQAGPAWTLLADGQVIASGGVAYFWPGVGEGWMLITKRAKRYPLALVKTMRKGMEEAAAAMKLRRIQATVKTEDRAAIKLAQILGFQIEGRLRHYGPDGKDYFMFGRIG